MEVKAMRQETSTGTPATWKKVSENIPQLSLDLSQLILPIIEGERDSLAWNYTLPVLETVCCISCGKQVAPVRLHDKVSALHDGEHEFNAEIFPDDNGAPRVDVTKPHRCAESVRYHDFTCSQVKDEDRR
jgi:hypothetical protein